MPESDTAATAGAPNVQSGNLQNDGVQNGNLQNDGDVHNGDDQNGNVQIGIDTGGTFTDAVALVTEHGGGVHVVATAKALTTKGDLSVGVGDALRSVLDVVRTNDPDAQVDLVSVSTTLATNAVVEGHGDRVGAVLVGFDDAMVHRIGIAAAFPDIPVIRIDGGHNHAGIELGALDLAALEAHLTNLVAQTPHDLRAFAVCSVFAVRNPEHELAVAAFITQRTGLPVTLSSQLTGALDATRRALTAILNARLVGRISRLITAVESASESLGLDCPILVVKGDGTRASADSIRFRPIETVMSGPAASTIGAAAMTGLADCIMCDVGGTTTDVAVLRAGRPTIREDGARIGGWNTLVRAADIRTYGLGGDSEVHVEKGAVVVGPHRVVPVSLLAERHPEVLTMLHADISASDVANAAQGRFCTLPFGATGSTTESLTDPELAIIGAIINGPRPIREFTTTARLQRVVQGLVRKGLVTISALSVADAAHVLDRQQTWSKEAALLATQLFVRVQIMRETHPSDVTSFAERILDATITQSGLAVFDTALGSETVNVADSVFLNDVAAGRTTRGGVSFSISPALPIVAVGGPAHLFYPEVGRRMGTDVVLTEHGAVANAVGAALGLVTAEVAVTVENTDGIYRVVSPVGASTHADLAVALAHAESLAESAAMQRCVDQGAYAPTTLATQNLMYLPGRTDDAGLLTATITATASGHPRTRSTHEQDPPTRPVD